MNGVSQASPGSQESQDSPDLRDPLDPVEKRVAMDLRDQGVRKESEAPLGYQDFQELQDFQVFPVRMDHQGPEECQAVTGRRVREVIQAVEESLDSRGYLVHRVCQDQRETPVM